MDLRLQCLINVSGGSAERSSAKDERSMSPRPSDRAGGPCRSELTASGWRGLSSYHDTYGGPALPCYQVDHFARTQPHLHTLTKSTPNQSCATHHHRDWCKQVRSVSPPSHLDASAHSGAHHSPPHVDSGIGFRSVAVCCTASCKTAPTTLARSFHARERTSRASSTPARA